MKTIFRSSGGRTLAPALVLACTLVGLAFFGRARPSHEKETQALVPALPVSFAPSASAIGPLVAREPDERITDVQRIGTTTLHGDPKRQHRTLWKGPTTPHLAWKTAVGGPVAAQVTTNPGGTLLFATTLAGELVTLAPDGSIRSRKNLGGRVYSAPTVGLDGTIYVGSDSGKFFALRENGDERWTFDARDEADTAPLLRPDGVVVFAAGKDVIGLSAVGKVVFRTTMRKKVFTAPALVGDRHVVVASQDDHVTRLDASGAVVWSVGLGADIDGGPVVDGDRVVVGTDAGEVVALAPDGKILWRTQVHGFVRGPLSVGAHGDILCGTYGPRPRMLRIAPDGAIVSEFAIQGTGAKEFGIHGGPLEDGRGTLYFGAQDDRVYAIGKAGLLFSFSTAGDVDAPLTLLSDGTLLAPSYDGFVYAFR